MWTGDSISKSFVTRSYASDSAVARRGEGDNVTDGLESELFFYRLRRELELAVPVLGKLKVKGQRHGWFGIGITRCF